MTIGVLAKRLENRQSGPAFGSGYLGVLCDFPAGELLALGEEYLRQQQELDLNANEPAPKAAVKSFASLAQMLLSSNEFLYVD